MAKTFGFESTTDEVLDGVDLSGKRVLITGVSAGLALKRLARSSRMAEPSSAPHAIFKRRGAR
jgi:hypothetical protein